MASGFLDNGIWQYGEDDSNATFSALLNRLASSTSDVVANIENDLNNTQAVLAAQMPGEPGIPYKNAAGTATTSTSAAVTVTLPSGRFNVAPIINAANVSGSSAAAMPYVSSVTASSFGISLYNVSGTRIAQNVHWTAVQMTSTTAAG